MLIRVGKPCIALALAFMLGGHWVVLQTVAWAAMLADNLQSCSVRDSLARTFDGKHPCPLCRAIAAGKKSEKKNEFTAAGQKLEFPPAGENAVLIGPSHFQLLPQADTFAESVFPRPPSPPPRGVAA